MRQRVELVEFEMLHQISDLGSQGFGDTDGVVAVACVVAEDDVHGFGAFPHVRNR